MRFFTSLYHHLTYLLVLFGLASCRSTPRSWLASGADENGTDVSMRIEENLPFMKVRLNDTPHEFLFDTGASDCVVTPETVRKLHLPLSRKTVKVRTAAGDDVALPMTIIPKLEIGSMTFTNVQALVHDCAKPRVIFPNLEGVIGFGLFQNSLLTLDYPESKLSVHPWRPLSREHPDVVPMRLHVGVPQIPVRVGSLQTYADVDSGSNGGLEMQRRSLAGKISGPLRPSGVSISIGREYRSASGRLDGSLFIGRVQLESPIVDVTEGDQRVGGQILKNLIITFDTRSGLAAVHLPGSSRFAAISPRLVSPQRYGIGLAFDQNWLVMDVLPGSSAAQQGVRRGDRCLAVNGRSTAQLDRQKLFHALSAADAATAFTFERNGRVRTSQLEMRPMVD